jgi:hypothetical protein
LDARKPIGMYLPTVPLHIKFRLMVNCVVAVGAEEPLAEHMMVADFFRKYILSQLRTMAINHT